MRVRVGALSFPVVPKESSPRAQCFFFISFRQPHARSSTKRGRRAPLLLQTTLNKKTHTSIVWEVHDYSRKLATNHDVWFSRANGVLRQEVSRYDLYPFCLTYKRGQRQACRRKTNWPQSTRCELSQYCSSAPWIRGARHVNVVNFNGPRWKCFSTSKLTISFCLTEKYRMDGLWQTKEKTNLKIGVANDHNIVRVLHEYSRPLAANRGVRHVNTINFNGTNGILDENISRSDSRTSRLIRENAAHFDIFDISVRRTVQFDTGRVTWICVYKW